ncbi:uncharacterized protein LOC129592982 [Paramacrobiotus metropolitanus]|uniref:uncharacterized protein LOC129592982 n=1 Tax=Paramacrobiotus metropolitanus TaxID=2943436 RepID=UPI0024462CEC|nr:uncharacterized protein LOC129592982 [Paramacrobiotus metropolitanus]
MINVVMFSVSSCRDIVVQAEDFTHALNIRALFFAGTTMVSIKPFTFSTLPNLEILSLEYGLRQTLANLIVPPDYYEYLHKLHCSCEFAEYRSWLQSHVINRMHFRLPDEMHDSNTTVQSFCKDTVSDSGAIFTVDVKEYNIGWSTEWLCLNKEDLYLPTDCGANPARVSASIINFEQTNYSINAPSCEKAVLRTCLTTSPTSHECYANQTKPMENDWTSLLSQQILRERRSELTTSAVDSAGVMYHYDDQALSADPPSESGHLPDDRFWPNNGKDLPYLINNFDSVDFAEIQDALSSISSQTSYCITFKTRTEEDDYIVFSPGNRCQSRVGRQGGQQSITLTQACIFRGAIQHLVLHALGLFHEHHRADRDGYLHIYLNRTELPPDSVVFRKLPRMPDYGTEYDMESIMQSGAFDFADPRNPDLPVFLPKVTSPKKQRRLQMGQRRTLSAKDIVELHTAYNCTVRRTNADAFDPLPKFDKSPLSQETCSTLSKLKRGNNAFLQNQCSKRNFILLVCNNSTTAADWKKVATTVAGLPLRAIALMWEDGPQRYEAPDAFRATRMLIISWFVQR